MSRRQYAESLDEWAELHGEHIEPEPADTLERCPFHGDYHAPNPLAAECPACIDDAHTPRRWWNDEYGADRSDAHYNAHE
jgi:hypothetical protein